MLEESSHSEVQKKVKRLVPWSQPQKKRYLIGKIEEQLGLEIFDSNLQKISEFVKTKDLQEIRSYHQKMKMQKCKASRTNKRLSNQRGRLLSRLLNYPFQRKDQIYAILQKSSFLPCENELNRKYFLQGYGGLIKTTSPHIQNTRDRRIQSQPQTVQIRLEFSRQKKEMIEL